MMHNAKKNGSVRWNVGLTWQCDFSPIHNPDEPEPKSLKFQKVGEMRRMRGQSRIENIPSREGWLRSRRGVSPMDTDGPKYHDNFSHFLVEKLN